MSAINNLKRDFYGESNIPKGELAWLQNSGATSSNLNKAWQEALVSNGYSSNIQQGKRDWLKEQTGIDNFQMAEKYALENNLYGFAKTFGELAQWYYNGFAIDENGRGYSKQGENIRDLVADMKTYKGDGTAFASVADLDLSGSSFKLKAWVYKSSHTAAVNMIFDSKDGSGFNGYGFGIETSGYATPNAIIFSIADADGTEVDLRYPAIASTTLTLVEIDWSLGSDPVVKYNGVTQTIDTTVANNTVTEFTANDTAFIGQVYGAGSVLNNTEINHLFVGDSEGFNHGWTLLDTGGDFSSDVIGTSHAEWTSPNWATPTKLGENWLNQVGYNTYYSLNGSSGYVTQNGLASDFIGASDTVDATFLIKLDDLSNSPAVLGVNKSGGNTSNIYITSSGQVGVSDLIGGYPTTATPITTDTLIKLRVVSRLLDDEADVYIDDAFLETITGLANMDSVYTSANQVSIGQEWDAAVASNLFNGLIECLSIKIDTVEIYDRSNDTLVGGASTVYVPAKNQLIDALGADLVNGSAKYPIQVLSSVIKGNGTNSSATATGITQTINSSADYKIRFRSTIASSGTGEMFIDARDSSQEDGFTVFKDTSHDFSLIVQVDGSNYRTVVFTPTIRTGATYEIWFRTSGIRLFENEVELTANSDTLTGTMSDISNSNDWVLLQRADKTNVTVSNQSISDLEVVDSRLMPLQEGASTVGYDVLGAGAIITYSNVSRENVSWASHYNSRYGFYNDGTRNIPATQANLGLDALGNAIDMVLSRLNDTFAEVDFNPESTIELTNLPNDYQIGDTPPSGMDKRVIGDAEDRLLYSPLDLSGENGYDEYMDDVV